MSRRTKGWVLACAAAAAGLAAPATLRADEEKKKGEPAEPRLSKEETERLASEQFSKHDKSGDGVLRGDEVPEKWAERFDRNGDGVIGRAEFLEVANRPPKLRRLHPMRDARARAADALRNFDQDKNGTVSREEYPGADHVFKNADRNRDGALQPAELLALANDELDDIRKRMKSPSRNEFLNLYDLERDNRVTQEEYDGPPAPFRKYDADGDGIVTYGELYPERMGNKESREMACPKPEDSNAIARLDKDGDGKVARDEFAGSDAAWRRLDRNCDGWVTVADAR